MDIYMYNAPLIEFYGPDIYLQKYNLITECFGACHYSFPSRGWRDEYGARRV